MEQIRKMVRKNVTTKRLTDQFYVDGDVNVPDVRNDIGRVIYSQGRLRIDEMKPMENYMRITGRVQYQILYVTEEGVRSLSSLQGKLLFDEMLYTEDAKGTPVLRGSSVELEVTVIHPRKVNLKALVEMEFAAEEQQEDVLTVDVEEEPGLYRKWESREMLKLLSAKRDICRIKEEFTLPAAKETVGTILYTEVAGRKLDTRLGADELQVRGELSVFVLYESIDGKPDWIEQTVPYVSRIEANGADDTMFHDLAAVLADETVEVRMDEDGELRVLGVEASLELRLAVYCEEQLDVLADLYSLEETLVPETEEITASGLVMMKLAKHQLTEQMRVPELGGDVLQICHSGGRLAVEHTEIVAGGILAEGVLHVCVLYVKADDEMPFAVWQGMVPFTYVVECGQVSAEMEYDLTGLLEQLNVEIQGDGRAEVRAAIGFRLFLKKSETFRNIREIKTLPVDRKEREKEPGIVGYTVREGDELWDLAKRYHTTTDGILRANGLESDTLGAGEKLLIFRGNMGIL